MSSAGKRPDLHGDCARCAALCCIAYAAEESPGFAATKAAGEACPKLGPDGLCTVYEDREQEGFSGCISYDCFGAGQLVVQELYGGRDWRDDPALLAPMLESFRKVRKACELLFLVDYARKRDLTGGQVELLEQVETRMLELIEQKETASAEKELLSTESKIRRLFAELGR